MRKIKGSNRGITFCSETATIGGRYRYVIDTEKSEVLIILDSGNNIVSRKNSGKCHKPLFDLRSSEVKKLVCNSSYMEIEEKDHEIVVRVYKKPILSNIRLFKQRICTVSDVLGVEAGQIIVPRSILRMATGTEDIEAQILSELSSIWNDEGTDNFVSPISSCAKKPEVEKIKTVYQIASLFSGAGLFDKAWLDGGRFRFVYGVDFCKDVLETYRYNIGNHIVCKDIRDVQADEIPFADVYCASPCCQAFSNANRRDFSTKKAMGKRLLIEEVVRLVKENLPKVVVIENVPQLLTREEGLYFSKVVHGLPEYEISTQVVTDCEVGGYSRRQRAIVIASRIGRIELPKVKVCTYKTVRDALSKVDTTWYNYDDVTIPSEHTKEKMSYIPQGGNWKDIPRAISKYGANTQSNVMRRLKMDEPAVTLSNFRKSNILHPTENRILTVAEAGAIMGLDKDFRFISKSLSAMQQMVANGVTQAIGNFVKNAVLNALENELKEENSNILQFGSL